MNINQILSLLRDAAKYIGAGTAGGYIIQSVFHIDPAQVGGALAGIGAILAIGASIWSQFSATKANTVAKAAAIVPIPAHVQVSAGVTTPVPVTDPPKNAVFMSKDPPKP